MGPSSFLLEKANVFEKYVGILIFNIYVGNQHTPIINIDVHEAIPQLIDHRHIIDLFNLYFHMLFNLPSNK
jgi:hypothetical protein